MPELEKPAVPSESPLPNCDNHQTIIIMVGLLAGVSCKPVNPLMARILNAFVRFSHVAQGSARSTHLIVVISYECLY